MNKTKKMDGTYVDIYFLSDYVFLTMIYDKTRQLHYILTKINSGIIKRLSVEKATARMRRQHALPVGFSAPVETYSTKTFPKGSLNIAIAR